MLPFLSQLTQDEEPDNAACFLPEKVVGPFKKYKLCDSETPKYLAVDMQEKKLMVKELQEIELNNKICICIANIVETS